MTDVANAPSLRVLLIEDEALVAMLLEDMVMDAGCETVGVIGELKAAVDYVSTKPESFDVAVLDVNLAGNPSFPIAQALAERGKPFVFSTGYGRDGLPDAWRDRPVLSKPFGAQAVIDVLKSLRTGV